MNDEAVYRTAPATQVLLINYKGVCRTAQARPGLLKTSEESNRHLTY